MALTSAGPVIQTPIAPTGSPIVPTAPSAPTSRRRWIQRRPPAVWFFRALLLVPIVFMAPEIVAAVQGRAGAVENISASTADVLGTGTFLIFVLMLTVTPIHTMTGWRWHLVLRRDYGIGMFAVALLDLILAATTTGDSFPGGVLDRVTGHTFLLAGTLSTVLLVPLVVTANRRAKRWLGPHWKWVHRLTYVVWCTIMLHLLLLFGLRTFFVDAVVLSVPLVVLRLGPVERRWANARRHRTHRLARAVAAVVCVGTFATGFVPFVQELATTGPAAFAQEPVRD
jgi:sulfoxide reductase heme-binding subunit YedZ